MGLVIRLAGPADFEAVNRLMRQIHELHIMLRPDIYKEAEQIFSPCQFQEFIAKEEFIVAEKDGSLAGLMLVQQKRTGDDSHVGRSVIHVDTIVVDESLRKQGIGRALIEYAIELRNNMGFDSVELQVNALNSGALEMYRHLGFTEKSLIMELKC